MRSIERWLASTRRCSLGTRRVTSCVPSRLRSTPLPAASSPDGGLDESDRTRLHRSQNLRLSDNAKCGAHRFLGCLARTPPPASVACSAAPLQLLVLGPSTTGFPLRTPRSGSVPRRAAGFRRCSPHPPLRNRPSSRPCCRRAARASRTISLRARYGFPVDRLRARCGPAALSAPQYRGIRTGNDAGQAGRRSARRTTQICLPSRAFPVITSDTLLN